MAVAPCMFSLPATEQITFTGGETGAVGRVPDRGVSFFNTATGGSVEIAIFGIQRRHK